MTVAATDAAGLEAHVSVVQITITANTAQGLAQTISDLLPERQRLHDQVRHAPDQPRRHTCGSAPTTVRSASPGTSTSSRACCPRRSTSATEDYTVGSRWTDLTVQPSIADFYPNLGNLTKSDARAIGLLIVMNDLRAKSEAYLDNAVVTADGSVTVNAEETAQLLSEATSTVTASGGSFYGTGTVQAITGQVVTNVVLASATASISDSDVTAGGDVERHRREPRRHRRDAARRRPTPATWRSRSRWRSTRSAGTRRTSCSTWSTRSSAIR